MPGCAKLPFSDHDPVSAEDIVVMIVDILYEYLPPGSGIEPKEAVSRVLEVIKSPLGGGDLRAGNGAPDAARRRPLALGTK